MAAKDRYSHIDEQLGFHPIEIFRSLKKHPQNPLLPFLFSFWPATEKNPFLVPVCLFGCMQTANTPYNSAEFILSAEIQYFSQNPGIPFLFAPLLTSVTSSERVQIARRMVAAGLDPNPIAPAALIKELLPKGRNILGKLFGMLEVTPLALAATMGEFSVVRELIKLGANPCLVCFDYPS